MDNNQEENILFFQEEIDFELENQDLIKQWLLNTIQEKEKELAQINIIFCSDEYLKQVNIEYLQHDYYTDIITFNNSGNSNIIETDIFISIDRVKENAIKENTTFITELHRVIIHGLLHLLGFNDKNEAQKQEMRAAENKQLEILKCST